MNKTCPLVIMLLYVIAVLVFLFAAFAAPAAMVLHWAIVGLALATFATLLKVHCCDCPRQG
jgi:hypothetical protein